MARTRSKRGSFFLLIFLLFLLPNASHAAIAIGANSTSLQSSATGATSLTYAFTCSGTNTYLLVYGSDESGDTYSSVKFNSVLMTQLKKISRNPNTGSLEIYAYGLANPSSSASNVVIRRTGTSGQIWSGAICFTGANQVTTPDAAASSNGTGSGASTITTSITTVAAGAAVTGFTLMDNNLNSVTNGTFLAHNTSTFPYGMWQSSTFPTATPGAYSFTGNGGTNSDVAQIIISIAPAVTVTNIPSFFSFW